jgi:hypothetical protein
MYCLPFGLVSLFVALLWAMVLATPLPLSMLAQELL